MLTAPRVKARRARALHPRRGGSDARERASDATSASTAATAGRARPGQTPEPSRAPVAARCVRTPAHRDRQRARRRHGAGPRSARSPAGGTARSSARSSSAGGSPPRPGARAPYARAPRFRASSAGSGPPEPSPGRRSRGCRGGSRACARAPSVERGPGLVRASRPRASRTRRCDVRATPERSRAATSRSTGLARERWSSTPPERDGALEPRSLTRAIGVEDDRDPREYSAGTAQCGMPVPGEVARGDRAPGRPVGTGHPLSSWLGPCEARHSPRLYGGEGSSSPGRARPRTPRTRACGARSPGDASHRHEHAASKGSTGARRGR